MKVAETVLIVDDDAMARLYASRVLARAGFTTIECASVDEGIRLAESAVPNLIVLDLMMPEKTGFDFLEERRGIPALKLIPVLVASGEKDRESIYRANSLGADDYVAKPYEPLGLIQKARKLLRDKKYKSLNLEKAGASVNVRFKGSITGINEAGLLVEALVRLSPESRITLRSLLFEKAGCTPVGFQVAPADKQPGWKGRFLNKVSLAGVSSADIEAIRRTVKSWK